MYRKFAPRNRELDMLLEQRDDLKIQISLLAEAPRSDPQRLSAMREELSNLEHQISHVQRTPY